MRTAPKNIVLDGENGKVTKLHISEAAYLNERGKIMLEVAAIAREIRLLNMRINGLAFTPKHLREERFEKMRNERGEKLKRLADLKKQYDALPDSTPAA